MFRARAHRQEVKIVLYSLWYHHTDQCDDTRDCIIQYYTVQQTVQQTYTVLSFLSFLQVFNDSSFSLGIQIIWDPL